MNAQHAQVIEVSSVFLSQTDPTPVPKTLDDIVEEANIEISADQLTVLESYFPEWILPEFAKLSPEVIKEMLILQCDMQVSNIDEWEAKQKLIAKFGEVTGYEDKIKPFLQYSSDQLLSFSQLPVISGNNFTVGPEHPTLAVIESSIANIQGDIVVDRDLTEAFGSLLKELETGDSQGAFWLTGSLNSDAWLNMLNFCGYIVPKIEGGQVHPSTLGATLTFAIKGSRGTGGSYDRMLQTMNRDAWNQLSINVLSSETIYFPSFREMIDLKIITDPSIIEAYTKLEDYAKANGGTIIDLTGGYSTHFDEYGKLQLNDIPNPVFSISFDPSAKKDTSYKEEIAYPGLETPAQILTTASGTLLTTFDYRGRIIREFTPNEESLERDRVAIRKNGGISRVIDYAGPNTKVQFENGVVRWISSLFIDPIFKKGEQ